MLGLLLLLAGCQPSRPVVAAAPPSATASLRPALDPAAAATLTADAPTPAMVTDPDFLAPGRAVYARDLLFRQDRLRRAADAMADGPERDRYRHTMALVEQTRHDWPQVTRFRVEARGEGLALTPLDWQAEIAVKRELHPRLAVVGGELESVIIAMAAADHGWPVALVYAGPLGGLCSDTGGNLRYFDGEPFLPRPQAQSRLFRDALGMAAHNYCALPRDISARLERYLRGSYARSITLVPTRSYNSLHVEVRGERIAGVVTEEGLRVAADAFIDTDPEARVGEKAGLTPSMVTPNLSYGLVFDVDGLREPDWAHLPTKLTPERVCALAHTSTAALPVGSAARHSADTMRHLATSEQTHVFSTTRFGYSTLAEGFNLYMQCRGLHDTDPELRWLNAARCTSGFNISLSGGRATFNSVSYHLVASVLQEDHDLRTDDRLRALMRIERPALESYLKSFFQDRNVRVLFPPQFYVRKASALFAMAHPYGSPDFLATMPRPGSVGLWMSYAMDLRDLRPRDEIERASMADFEGFAGGRRTWRCRGSATKTAFENLYLCNKSAMPARYYGGMRILQNLISTGVALVGDLAAGR